jgi:hypothetical protein
MRLNGLLLKNSCGVIPKLEKGDLLLEEIVESLELRWTDDPCCSLGRTVKAF